MNNIQVSFEALKRGKQWYEGTIEAFKHKRWNDVVYMYQMAIEQAMKSILILDGIEYPRRHDMDYGKDDFKEEAFFYKEQVNQIIQDCTRLLNDFLRNYA